MRTPAMLAKVMVVVTLLPLTAIAMKHTSVSHEANANVRDMGLSTHEWGTIIAAVKSDTVVEPSFYQSLVRCFDSHQNYVLIPSLINGDHIQRRLNISLDQAEKTKLFNFIRVAILHHKQGEAQKEVQACQEKIDAIAKLAPLSLIPEVLKKQAVA